MASVRTRIAPSPTGYMHIGNLRTAFYSYLWAKKNHGEYIIRIEDTDRTRYVEDAVDMVFAIHEILGMMPDEGPHKDGGVGPYIQTERLDIYAPRLHALCDEGTAYYCFCTSERLEELKKEQEMLKLPPRYDGHCRHIPLEEAKERVASGEKYTIRLKVPKAEKIFFDDLVMGRLEFNTSEVDDQVLLKSDGIPTYHGAVVIDDFLMKITHVIRGQEWMSSIPKQVLTARALHIELPHYAHVPGILGNDGKKLSKRTGDVSVSSYFEKGYLPEVLLNFIVLLGWNPKTEQEIMTREEMIELFDISQVHRAGAVFNPVKLDWMNGEYIRMMDTGELHIRLSDYLRRYFPDFYTLYSEKDFAYNEKIIQEVQVRMKRLSEFPELALPFYTRQEYNVSLFLNPKMKVETLHDVRTALELASLTLENTDFSTLDDIKNPLLGQISEKGYKNGFILWPLRVALSGMEFSPGAFECAYILGKEEVFVRLQKAFEKLDAEKI